MWSNLVFMGMTLMSGLAAPPAEAFSQAALEDAYNRLTPAIALLAYSTESTNQNTGEVSKRGSNALGLIVSPAGLVMAHGHMVLENAQPFSIKVTVGQGDEEKEYDAVLLKKPDDVNVVFLQVQSDEPLNLPYVRFVHAADLDLGQPLAVFGILGEALDYQRGVNETRIGAVLNKPRKTYCLESTVRFGSVGGPVIDTAGQAVGVVGFDLSREEGGDLYTRSGHPLLYQAALFQKYIDDPPSETEVKNAGENAWLGVFTQPLNDDYAEYWGLDLDGGLIVSTVVPGSPADNAGLRPGDIILHFDGTPIAAKLDRDVLSFTKLVRDAGPNKEVSIRLLRDGKPEEMRVTLGTRPRTSSEADEYEDPVLGLTVRELTTDVRIALNLSEDVQGVIVRRVKSGGAAQIAKMRPGVIVMGLGDHPVTSIGDFKEAVKRVAEARPSEVAVFARAGTETGFFRLQPRWNGDEQP